MIFAFGHHKNVGKDQFIKFCLDILKPRAIGKRMLRRGFADKLYDICFQLYAWAGFRERIYYMENPSKKSEVLINGKTPREILIKVGNKLREYDSDIWINANLREAHFDHLFISDCRYPNEATVVKDLGGKVIKITRKGLEEPTDEADTALNGYDGWDMLIENNGDLPSLYQQAVKFCDRFFPDNRVVM